MKTVMPGRLRREIPLYIMLVPAIVLVVIFSYIPMFGIIMAFEKYYPATGILHSEWIGLGNFKYLLELPEAFRALWNTIYIASMKIVAGLFFPIVIALLLNEITKTMFKRTIQTLIYLPYFLSWIILGGIVLDIFSLKGAINQILGLFGSGQVFFLGDNRFFPFVLVGTDLWKNFGFNTIVYLAAITSINPNIYEAVIVDGANRWSQTWYVTLPGMIPIIVLVATLSMGDILSAGFDQVFNLYNPAVYQSGDIIDTLVYRLGMIGGRYGLASAVGLFKSVVSMILISSSYYIAYKTVDYRIF